MEQIELNAQQRVGRGKGFARKARRNGLIPAIIYGPKTDPIPLTFDALNLQKALKSLVGKNAIINLIIEGQGKSIKKVGILKDYQIDPLKRTYLHADFYEISMDAKITVSVSLHLVGKPVGLDNGGILNHILREIEVECLPSNIPDSINVDVSGLDLGHSIQVSTIPFEKGIELLTDAKLTIATVVAPAEEKEEVVEEEEAGAEGEDVSEPDVKEKGREEKPTKATDVKA